MQGIKNIIFDLGGVILNLDNRRTEDAFVARISDREFIDSVRQLTGLAVPDQDIIDSWNALLLDFPAERIQLLKELRKNYRLFLFSNTNALHLAALQQIWTGTFGDGSLDQHFEKTYYSHLMGIRKPDRESFEFILKENHLNAQETLFVDDAIINVEGAELAGLKGLFLRPGISLLDFQW